LKAARFFRAAKGSFFPLRHVHQEDTADDQSTAHHREPGHGLAQQYHAEVTAAYAIGDEQVTYHIGGHGEHHPDTLPDAPDLTLPFADIIERARLYVFTQFGSFEKFAEYGLIA
jgi:hypothetical protein